MILSMLMGTCNYNPSFDDCFAALNVSFVMQTSRIHVCVSPHSVHFFSTLTLISLLYLMLTVG